MRLWHGFRSKYITDHEGTIQSSGGGAGGPPRPPPLPAAVRGGGQRGGAAVAALRWPPRGGKSKWGWFLGRGEGG